MTESSARRRPALVAALRTLAQRRLTEAQLWQKLERRGFDDAAIRETIEYCKLERYVDDRVFAELFVETTRQAVGDARLVAALVKKGIDREAACAVVEQAARSENERLAAAFEKLMRRPSPPSYPSAARALERLGFPAPSIYRYLRAHAREAFSS